MEFLRGIKAKGVKALTLQNSNLSERPPHLHPSTQQTSLLHIMPAPSYSFSREAEAVDAPAQGLSGEGVYYNARLDPKNFLEGPLSPNPSTRLRQMLARPGIVVSISSCFS